jgi:tight adherence protein B
MGPFFVPLVYVLAFIAVVLVVQTGAGIVLGARDRSKQVNRRLTMLHSGMKPTDVYASLVKRPSGDLKIENARLLNAYEQLSTYCRQAGLTMTPLRLLAIALASTGVLWLIALSFVRSTNGGAFAVNAVISLLGAALLSCATLWTWLNRMRTGRLRKLEEQLPLALDVVVRAIRAGHPVVSAVQLAAEELGDPIGSEFGIIVDEYTYGSDFREALRNFARRTGSSDAHFFAVSVGIQADTGGNLAEILEGLASVIRARRALAKKVKALASEGRASALVLSVLPIFLVGFLMFTQPSYYTEKFGDPLFWPFVIGVLLLYGVGWLSIQRIINFKY